MRIEGNSGNALTMGTGLVHIPGIVGGISRHMPWKAPQYGHGLEEQREVIADITLVEGLGELSKHHIPIACDGSADDARAVAPQIFLALLFGAIGLVLVGAAFDAHATVWVATRLTLFTEAILDRLAQVVLADPGIL